MVLDFLLRTCYLCRTVCPGSDMVLYARQSGPMHLSHLPAGDSKHGAPSVDASSLSSSKQSARRLSMYAGPGVCQLREISGYKHLCGTARGVLSAWGRWPESLLHTAVQPVFRGAILTCIQRSLRVLGHCIAGQQHFDVCFTAEKRDLFLFPHQDTDQFPTPHTLGRRK